MDSTSIRELINFVILPFVPAFIPFLSSLNSSSNQIIVNGECMEDSMKVTSFEQEGMDYEVDEVEGNVEGEGEGDETGEEGQLIKRGTKPAIVKSVPKAQIKSQPQAALKTPVLAAHNLAATVNHKASSKKCLSDQALIGGVCKTCPTGSFVAPCGTQCDCKDPHAKIVGKSCVW